MTLANSGKYSRPTSVEQLTYIAAFHRSVVPFPRLSVERCTGITTEPNKAEVIQLKPIKAIVTVLAMSALTLSVSAASFANNNIANISATPQQAADFTFTGGVGGTLQTVPAGIKMDASGPLTTTTDAVFKLSSIQELTAATASGGGYTAGFGGGNFSIVDNLGSGPVLLSGTFTGSTLTSATTSSGTLLSLGGLTGVSYTTGTQYVNEFLSFYGGSAPVAGTFSLSLSAINPNLSNTGAGGGLAAFAADGTGGTFDAQSSTVVPEPSEIVTLALGGFALCGMMLFARRRTGLEA